MLHIITADFHIHTCLSPCGDLDMTPTRIAGEAVKKGLSMIAITDHNSAENVQAVSTAASGSDLTIVPGMEITSSEEAHIIALFESLEDVSAMQEIVFNTLQPGENNDELFGMQVVANELDEVEGFNKRLLIGATTMSIEKVVDEIHRLNGLAVAAHIDRESYSIIGQLGFIPPDLELDALGISRNMTLNDARRMFSEYERFPFLTSSDAHYPDDIGAASTRLFVEKANFSELRMALDNIDGRKIIQGDQN